MRLRVARFDLLVFLLCGDIWHLLALLDAWFVCYCWCKQASLSILLQYFY